LVSAEVPLNQDPNHREVRRVAVYVENVKEGSLQPCLYVDVVHTVTSPQKSASRVILKNVFVHWCEAPAPDEKKGAGVLLVTLEVDVKQSRTLLDARDTGSLSLLLLPIPGTMDSR
jgi:Flp pilus assembly protein CpaB